MSGSIRSASGSLTAVIAVAVLFNPSADAQTIQDAAAELAASVKEILDVRKVRPAAVSVESFEIKPEFSPLTTLDIQKRLIEQLKSEMVSTDNPQIQVKGSVQRNKYYFWISGEVYFRDENESVSIRASGRSEAAAAKAEQELKKSGKIGDQQPVSAVVDSVEDVVSLAAPTFESDHGVLNRNERKRAHEQEIGDGLDDPMVYVSGATVSAYEDSQFRIEILTRGPDGRYSQRPRVSTTETGQAFVDLNRGDELSIRIINDSDYDVGVKILLDGLNSFAFSNNDGYRRLGMYLIEKNSRQPVNGWHLDNKHVYRFNVTTLPDSAVNELRRSSNQIGVISVQFFPAWKEGEPIPAAELAEARNSSGRGLAVGRGDVTAQQAQNARRYVGKTMVAAISVRYQHP
ncbi:MAG: hypothetical protein RIK87_09750 [Fuerstiella sp.]